MFWILAGILAITSAIMAALGVQVMMKGKPVRVRNLLSIDGLRMSVDSALAGYQDFPPLITIMVVIMGVAIAERSGFLNSWMKTSISRVPPSLIVFTVAFMGTVSHVASAAAYVILVPLGGIAFRAVGRSPVLGVVVAYTAIASGYDASPIPTPNDAIFAGITTAAAKLVNPEAYVSPLSNWYFNIASSFLLAVVITIVTELVLMKRTNLGADEDAVHDEGGLEISPQERRGLRWAGIVFVVGIIAIALSIIPGIGFLLAPDGGLNKSPFLKGIAYIIALLFGFVGIAYGVGAGTIKKSADVPALMAEGLRTMAPVLVLFFSISQFLVFFDWTNIGDVMSINAASSLRGLGLPIWVIFLIVLALLSVVNVLITSGSAMWSIMAPVIVPLLMHLSVPPDTAQALFRIADSGSTAITPMSPYFIMALGFMQRYQKSAGIGTLASHTLPLAIAMTLSWSLLFFAWWGLGIPLGPGAPVR
ncbi:AbgT family transporter [Mariniluteicoccus flavus]